jgi:hypothetical protein
VGAPQRFLSEHPLITPALSGTVRDHSDLPERPTIMRFEIMPMEISSPGFPKSLVWVISRTDVPLSPHIQPVVGWSKNLPVHQSGRGRSRGTPPRKRRPVISRPDFRRGISARAWWHREQRTPSASGTDGRNRAGCPSPVRPATLGTWRVPEAPGGLGFLSCLQSVSSATSMTSTVSPSLTGACNRSMPRTSIPRTAVIARMRVISSQASTLCSMTVRLSLT